ncbi:MAG: class I SAM-dependent methyltransferase [Acidimicrobiales bacterium]
MTAIEVPLPSDPSVRDRYEREAAVVDRYGAKSFWDRRYHRRRFDAVAVQVRQASAPGRRVLDVGCGTGDYLAVARHAGAVAVGCDLAVGYCERAAAHAAGRVVVADGTALPFADRSFDTVLCSEVIEHLPAERLTALLDELRRVCAGTLVVTTPNDQAALRRLGRRLAPAHVRRLDDEVGHISLLDRVALTGLLAAPGWTVQSCEVFHVLPPIVGELARLPQRLAPVIDRVERLAGRFAAPAGNAMVATAVRTGAR